LRGAALALALAAGCAAPGAAAPAAGGTWAYRVALVNGGRELAVDAVFPPGPALALDVPPAARPFVLDLALARSRAGWVLSASAQPRALSWRFRAREAAAAIDDPDLAAWRGGFAGSLAAFLLADGEAAGAAGMRLEVESGPGLSFACALPESGGAYEAPAAELNLWPACAFGAIAVEHRRVGESELVVAQLASGDGSHAAALDAWIAGAAEGLAAYLGGFPVERLLLVLAPRDAPGVGHGRTRGFGGAAIVIEVSPGAGEDELRADWVLWHELVHLALPSLARRHEWLGEGSATYVEPLLRARAGLLSEEEVWAAMLDEYPQGLPAPGDRGLDLDGSWGRTYYGGALFCLEADVEIRARTQNRRSLQDALAAVAAAGGNVTQTWPLERVLALGDRATGTAVLSELYAARRASPGPDELDSLWRRLGVAAGPDGVVFDDAAPLAHVRRALILGP
jgi:hypothetical protein